MPQQIVLGLGVGQCGLDFLAEILQKQHGSRITTEQTPILPWKQSPDLPGIRERIARWKETCPEAIVGDVASFYLPYVEQAIQIEPLIRIVCLKRPRDEVVRAFCHSLDSTRRVPTNHWSETLSVGWSHDPLWTQAFPQYATTDREEAIGLYWDEYDRRASDLAKKFPKHFLILDAAELYGEVGVRGVLDFIGIRRVDQVIPKATHSFPSPPASLPIAKLPTARNPLDPAKCVILVPFTGFIHPECDDALKELERRGYPVRRVGGYAAIDQGRNQMATDAMVDGFEETVWIDSDIGFHADDVERLRSHPVSIVSGIYPQKGKRSIAGHILPGTLNIVFGEAGGLVEMLYLATGFLLVRREAYLGIQRTLHLPVCNERHGRPTIPYFMPMIRTQDDGHWYLAEDYSFCERARQSGFKCYADTRIRLWHIGWYRYGWEDAGIDRQRFQSFNLDVSGK